MDNFDIRVVGYRHKNAQGVPTLFKLILPDQPVPIIPNMEPIDYHNPDEGYDGSAGADYLLEIGYKR